MKKILPFAKAVSAKSHVFDEKGENMTFSYKKMMKLVKDSNNDKEAQKVSDKEAEDAFRTILSWLGEDPSREGLLETPKRVMKAYKEYFSGYKVDPNKILDKTFGDVDGYEDIVKQKNICLLYT